MRFAHRVETVRAAEAALMATLPDGTLMARAAAGLAASCAQLLGGLYGRRIALLVGSGANGGDALLAGARLVRRGATVKALLLDPDRAHPGALAALRLAGGWIVPATAAQLADADLVVDGITGIGGRGGLRPHAAELVRAVRAPVVAVDVPSGVDADTGEVAGEAVRAAATVTFGTYKNGLLIDPGHAYAGAVRLIDIGLGPYLPGADLAAPQHADVARLLPLPTAASDKYGRGVVGVAAGSERYPGAAVLAVGGALCGGAGAVRYVGPAREAVIARWPEALVHAGAPGDAGRVQAWVVGPGLGEGAEAAETVAQVLASDVPVLVDADGLRYLTPHQIAARTAPTLITPHAGEAARLLGVDRAQVEARRLSALRKLAAAYGVTALLKGNTTLVSGTPARVNPTGTPWLATAGSGDVLSGLTGALLAAGLPPTEAAMTGAYLHGLAGRRAAQGGGPTGRVGWTGEARDTERDEAAAARRPSGEAYVPGAPITAMDLVTALGPVWREVSASGL
ncbi:NAD(P)H-hydrate dehydratase [Streptomyces polyrhachis]|uniref:Bifunctional NAD(P)H-hydrate repair enzyme n=1 Tax=Streptomyces polyrhachis TaxID=1282885 RepID=A0ABW2GHN7_9ACTN